MPGIVKFSDASHWYECRNGAPAPRHEADLRVARKEGLYPSVTNLIKAAIPNPFLDKWKVEQVLFAAMNSPRQPHQSPEDYANTVYQLSLDKPRDAADFGTRLHAAIEEYPKPPPDDVLPWWLLYQTWHESNVASVVASEKIVVDHDLGVAGRLDQVITHRTHGLSVVDIKTQGVKTDPRGRKAPAFYESWVMQLGFYAISEAKETGGFPDSIPTCISLIFDSGDPLGPIYERVWAKGEVLHAYRQFVCAAWLYFSGNAKRKAFWPGMKGPWTINPSIPMPL